MGLEAIVEETPSFDHLEEQVAEAPSKEPTAPADESPAVAKGENTSEMRNAEETRPSVDDEADRADEASATETPSSEEAEDKHTEAETHEEEDVEGIIEDPSSEETKAEEEPLLSMVQVGGEEEETAAETQSSEVKEGDHTDEGVGDNDGGGDTLESEASEEVPVGGTKRSYSGWLGKLKSKRKLRKSKKKLSVDDKESTDNKSRDELSTEEKEETTTKEEDVTTDISSNEFPHPTKPTKPRWKAVQDASSGSCYYYDRKSRETTWVKPDKYDENWAEYEIAYSKYMDFMNSKLKASQIPDLGNEAEDPPKPLKRPSWKCVKDASSGRAYYFNKKNGETTWEKPEAFDEQVAAYRKAKEELRQVSLVDVTGQNEADAETAEETKEEEKDPSHESTEEEKEHSREKEDSQQVTAEEEGPSDDAGLVEELTSEEPTEDKEETSKASTEGVEAPSQASTIDLEEPSQESAEDEIVETDAEKEEEPKEEEPGLSAYIAKALVPTCACIPNESLKADSKDETLSVGSISTSDSTVMVENVKTPLLQEEPRYSDDDEEGVIELDVTGRPIPMLGEVPPVEESNEVEETETAPSEDVAEDEEMSASTSSAPHDEDQGGEETEKSINILTSTDEKELANDEIKGYSSKEETQEIKHNIDDDSKDEESSSSVKSSEMSVDSKTSSVKYTEISVESKEETSPYDEGSEASEESGEIEVIQTATLDIKVLESPTEEDTIANNGLEDPAPQEEDELLTDAASLNLKSSEEPTLKEDSGSIDIESQELKSSEEHTLKEEDSVISDAARQDPKGSEEELALREEDLLNNDEANEPITLSKRASAKEEDTPSTGGEDTPSTDGSSGEKSNEEQAEGESRKSKSSKKRKSFLKTIRKSMRMDRKSMKKQKSEGVEELTTKSDPEVKSDGGDADDELSSSSDKSRTSRESGVVEKEGKKVSDDSSSKHSRASSDSESAVVSANLYLDTNENEQGYDNLSEQSPESGDSQIEVVQSNTLGTVVVIEDSIPVAKPDPPEEVTSGSGSKNRGKPGFFKSLLKSKSVPKEENKEGQEAPSSDSSLSSLGNQEALQEIPKTVTIESGDNVELVCSLLADAIDRIQSAESYLKMEKTRMEKQDNKEDPPAGTTENICPVQTMAEEITIKSEDLLATTRPSPRDIDEGSRGSRKSVSSKSDKEEAVISELKVDVSATSGTKTSDSTERNLEKASLASSKGAETSESNEAESGESEQVEVSESKEVEISESDTPESKALEISEYKEPEQLTESQEVELTESHEIKLSESKEVELDASKEVEMAESKEVEVSGSKEVEISEVKEDEASTGGTTASKSSVEDSVPPPPSVNHQNSSTSAEYNADQNQPENSSTDKDKRSLTVDSESKIEIIRVSTLPRSFSPGSGSEKQDDNLRKSRAVSSQDKTMENKLKDLFKKKLTETDRIEKDPSVGSDVLLNPVASGEDVTASSCGSIPSFVSLSSCTGSGSATVSTTSTRTSSDSSNYSEESSEEGNSDSMLNVTFFGYELCP